MGDDVEPHACHARVQHARRKGFRYARVQNARRKGFKHARVNYARRKGFRHARVYRMRDGKVSGKLDFPHFYFSSWTSKVGH